MDVIDMVHQRSYLGIFFSTRASMIRTFLSFKTKLYAKNYHISATLGGMIDNRPFVAFNCQRRIFRALIVAMMGAINSLMVEIIWTSDGNTFLVFSSNVRKHKIRIRIFRLMDFFSEKNIVGPHGFPDPPSLAQMTFTQCTSMSELKLKLACGSVKMFFFCLVTRFSMTICIVWCQCVFGVFFTFYKCFAFFVSTGPYLGHLPWKKF